MPTRSPIFDEALDKLSALHAANLVTDLEFELLKKRLFATSEAKASSSLSIVAQRSSVGGQRASALPSVGEMKAPLKPSALKRTVEWAKERKRDQKEQKVRSIFTALEKMQPHLSKTFWNDIQEKYKETDLERKLGYFTGITLSPLEERVQWINAVLAQDTDRVKTSGQFEALGRDLLGSLDRNSVGTILADAVKEHTESTVNIGSSVLTGIAMANRQRVAAAYILGSSIRESYKAGQHNGSVQRLFHRDVYDLKFVQPKVNISEIHRQYTHFAWRLETLGLGDTSKVCRAKFSLVYNNGNCRIVPAVEADKYGRAAPAEFINRFRHYFWSPAEAVSHLDEIRKSSEDCERAFSANGLRLLASSASGHWTYTFI